MIRFMIGLLMVMGAVGGMEDPANSLLVGVVLAVCGLAIMAAGVNKVVYQ